ncbi:MAG: Gfo/Idh/MocA family oxidoreductase [Saprospiraceae bacterium]|nr:Gfo/Idh/MocA family oxidoreductase [Saprospiraceae bacterium]
MKRRNFIQSTSLTLGSVALKTSLIDQVEKKKLGVALVGLGNYSTHQLAPALQLTANCQLAGVVTGDPAKGKSWSAKYGFPERNIYNYTNFDAIENNSEIDIIYIVLPNFMHHEYTIRALQTGKHVICEKPLAIHSKDAQEMVDEAKKQNRKLQVGYRLYFEPHHLAIQNKIRENGLEDLRMMEASLGFDMARPGLWRIDKVMGGGGAIIDLGLYAIQAARRTKGALPVKVRANGQIIRKELFKGVYENMFWQLEFPDGTVCNSSTSYSTYVDRFFASQKSQWYELNPAFNGIGAKGNSHEGPLVVNSIAEFQQIAQMDEFVESIKADRPSLAHGAEGVIDVKIVEAVIASADKRDEVEIDWT